MKWSWIVLMVFLLSGFQSAGQVFTDEIAPGKLILKVKPEYRDYCYDDRLDLSRLKPVLDRIGVTEVKKMFPHHQPPKSDRAIDSQGSDRRVDISLIYVISFPEKYDSRKVAASIRNTGTVVYAEPRIIPKVTLVPSDPSLDTMWHLPIIKAFEAWDIDTGSSETVIAIVDTGVDWDHPDLVDAIYKNTDEIPNNGIDDDSNDFVDDYLGWNFFDENNNPMETSFSHGTHVAGLAGATANNGVGVAGVSWNGSIMAVKAGTKLELPFGYEGVVYAADNGADIINCSWGSFSRSDYAHDIVKYATYNKGALMIGGAGNDNRENLFYPASYVEVMSIASSDTVDRKSDFSNYNYHIDLVAPGSSIFSLKNHDGEANRGYGFDSGTSMSAPIVAGAAALVMHRYQQLGPRQVMEQLRVTADPIIYALDSNQQYTGKLGTGRLDVEQALLSLSSPALRVEFAEITDTNDKVFTLGESIYVGIELSNYLLAIDDVKVTISSMEENIDVEKGTWNISTLPQNGRTNNLNAPFELRLSALKERNQSVTLKISATSPHTDYVMEEYIAFSVNQDYVNVNVNNIATTFSKHGLIGYTDYLQTDGLGFRLETQGNLLYEAGLMIAHEKNGAKRVVDRVRNGDFADQDFWPYEVIDRSESIGGEAYTASGSFTDTSAIRDEIGLKIYQQVTAYDDEDNSNYVIVEYTIENITSEPLLDVSIGLLADWDIKEANLNMAKTAFGKRLGYVYHTGEEVLTAGIQALGEYPFRSYMIDNVSGGAGGVDIFDEAGFTSEDKYECLTTNRLEAGENTAEGNDVIQVNSMTDIDIEANGSVTVAFAIHAGRSIEQVHTSADHAFEKYNGYLPGENIDQLFEIRSLWPNPTSSDLNISFDLAQRTPILFKIYDAHGILVSELETETLYPGFNQLQIDVPELETGLYHLNMHTIEHNQSISFEYIAR